MSNSAHLIVGLVVLAGVAGCSTTETFEDYPDFREMGTDPSLAIGEWDLEAIGNYWTREVKRTRRSERTVLVLRSDGLATRTRLGEPSISAPYSLVPEPGGGVGRFRMHVEQDAPYVMGSGHNPAYYGVDDRWLILSMDYIDGPTEYFVRR